MFDKPIVKAFLLVNTEDKRNKEGGLSNSMAPYISIDSSQPMLAEEQHATKAWVDSLTTNVSEPVH